MSAKQIFVLGTSQSVASAAMREQMYVDLEEVYETLGELLKCGTVLDEAVPLATCGRLELYCVAEDPDRAVKLLVRMMERRTGLARNAFREHVYTLRGGRGRAAPPARRFRTRLGGARRGPDPRSGPGRRP